MIRREREREKHDLILAELLQLKSENKTKILAIEDKIVILKGDYDTRLIRHNLSKKNLMD